jgi:hypothetical protein
MAGSQRQSAVDGSTAVQAAGDVSINNGLTTPQMVEIITALSSHVETLGNGARVEIEARLKTFEDGLMERFATDDTTRSEAFRDPDFLAATLDAQKAYARSGDDGLRGVLTDLVAQRSKIEKRSRLSLTLNDAIAKVGSIPEADLNTLSLIFLLQKVHHNGVSNLQSLAGFISSAAVPLLSNVSNSDSAVSYLAAHGCVLPPSGFSSQIGALEILLKSYGSIVKKGATEEALRAKFDNYDVLVAKGLVVNSPYGNDLKVFSHSGPVLDQLLGSIGIFGKYSDEYDELTKDANPSTEEFQPVFALHLPVINDFITAYDHPNIRDSRLTSIGIALAHANLAKGPLRGADLSVWINS